MYTQKQVKLKEEIIKVVYTDKGKLNPSVGKKEWYERRNIVDIYNSVLKLTPFLDKFGATVRTRIYHILNEITELPRCNYCNKNEVLFKQGRGFELSCSDAACIRLRKAQTLRNTWALFSEEKKDVIREKIGNKVRGRTVSENTKQKIREINTGRKQSQETKDRRVETRKNNRRPWHTEDSKNRISETNKRVHSSKEFREKVKEVRVVAAKKASETMKRKIQQGLFTPCITNSWTRWKAYITSSTGDIKHFRSSWEALFYLHNKDLEYETVRIPYTFEETVKIYIVDFVDRRTKTLYEIKPASTVDTPKNKEKSKAAIDWCLQEGYRYEIIGEEWFKQNSKTLDLTGNEHLLERLQKII